MGILELVGMLFRGRDQRTARDVEQEELDLDEEDEEEDEEDEEAPEYY